MLPFSHVGQVFQLVVHVHGVDVPKVDQLLQGLINKNDTDKGSEGLFREAGYVADETASISGNQQQAKEGRPKSDTGPQGQIR